MKNTKNQRNTKFMIYYSIEQDKICFQFHVAYGYFNEAV